MYWFSWVQIFYFIKQFCITFGVQVMHREKLVIQNKWQIFNWMFASSHFVFFITEFCLENGCLRTHSYILVYFWNHICASPKWPLCHSKQMAALKQCSSWVIFLTIFQKLLHFLITPWFHWVVCCFFMALAHFSCLSQVCFLQGTRIYPIFSTGRQDSLSMW